MAIKKEVEQALDLPEVGQGGTIIRDVFYNPSQSPFRVHFAFSIPHKGVSKLGLIGDRITVLGVLGKVVETAIQTNKAIN